MKKILETIKVFLIGFISGLISVLTGYLIIKFKKNEVLPKKPISPIEYSAHKSSTTANLEEDIKEHHEIKKMQNKGISDRFREVLKEYGNKSEKTLDRRRKD